MGVEANSPRGRVRAAEKAYANNSMSYKQYAQIAKGEGYTPAKAEEVKEMFGKKRRPKK